MKILFLSPPSKDLDFPPLGIAYITSFLNKNGHEAIIFDGHNNSHKEIVSAVRKINPQIVGITMNTSTRFEGLCLAKEIKNTLKIPIILGGPHPTLMPEQILKNYPYIDYLVRNEGEYVCLNLLDALEANEKLNKIKGISYKEGGKIFHNERAEPLKDLDTLPYPEYKFFNLKGYAKHPLHPKEFLEYPAASIITSRGCPFNCTFCSSSHLWGHKIRFRKPKEIVDEIEYLYSEKNVRFVFFYDDNFTADKKRVVDICKTIIERGLHKKIKWLCKSEVNVITREMLEWLKKAGCCVIEYGIEDGSPEGLKFFRKPHTIQQVLEAFKLTHEAGLEIVAYFIIGGDHESPENVQRKKKFIEKINPTLVTASLLLAYPGTEIYEIGKRRGQWDDNILLQPCVGREYHYRVPIFYSKNMNLEQMFEASADIDYWWNKKKGNLKLKNILIIISNLIKNRDFSKLYSMSKSIMIHKIKHN